MTNFLQPLDTKLFPTTIPTEVGQQFNPVAGQLYYLNNLTKGKVPLYNTQDMKSLSINENPNMPYLQTSNPDPIYSGQSQPPEEQNGNSNIYERYKQAIENFPTLKTDNPNIPYKPNWKQRLLAGFVGMGYGPKAGEQVLLAPYYDQLQNYDVKTHALGSEAKSETQDRSMAYKSALEMAQRYEAMQKGNLANYQQSDKYALGRFGYKPHSMDEATKLYNLEHPGKNPIEPIRGADGLYHDIMFNPDGSNPRDLGISRQYNDPQELEKLKQTNRLALESQKAEDKGSLLKQRMSQKTSQKNLLPSQQRIALQLKAQQFLRTHPDLQDKIEFNPLLGRFEAKSSSEWYNPATWGSVYQVEANKANEQLQIPQGVTEVTHSKSSAFQGFAPTANSAKQGVFRIRREKRLTTQRNITQERKANRSRYQREY